MRPLHQSLSPLMYYLLGEVIFVSPMFLKGEQIFSKTICHYDCVRVGAFAGLRAVDGVAAAATPALSLLLRIVVRYHFLQVIISVVSSSYLSCI